MIVPIRSFSSTIINPVRIVFDDEIDKIRLDKKQLAFF